MNVDPIDLENKSKIKIQKKDLQYECHFCFKPFKDRGNRSRHQNYGCDKNPKKLTNPNKLVHGNKIFIPDKEEKQECVNLKVDHLCESATQIVNNNINNNILNTINVHITDKVDFIDILTNRYGDRTKAVEKIKKYAYGKSEKGDIDLFKEIYLNGPQNTWNFYCSNKKTCEFQYIDKNNTIITDKGGVLLYNTFRENYQKTLLRLSHSGIETHLKHDMNEPGYEDRLNYLLDDFDIGCLQTKAFNLMDTEPISFCKKLSMIAELCEKPLIFFKTEYENMLNK